MNNFNELYEKARSKNPEAFEQIEKSNKLVLSSSQFLILFLFVPLGIIPFVSFIFWSLMLFIVLIFIYIICFIIVITILGLKESSQKTLKNNDDLPYLYKDIFSSILKQYNPSFNFSASRYEQSETKYRLGYFEEHIEFHSNDTIIGKIDEAIPIAICDIKAFGKSTNATINNDFIGLFCICTLPINTNSVIALRSDVKTNSFSSNQPKLNMDNASFESKFNVYASDRLLAMRIFTADFMQYILDYHNGINPPFAFTINNNQLLIRIRTDRDSFELQGKRYNKSLLESDLKAIDTACNICKKIYTNISEKDI